MIASWYLYIKKVWTNTGKQTIGYAACIIWDKVPLNLKELSIHQFWKQLNLIYCQNSIRCTRWIKVLLFVVLTVPTLLYHIDCTCCTDRTNSTVPYRYYRTECTYCTDLTNCTDHSDSTVPIVLHWDCTVLTVITVMTILTASMYHSCQFYRPCRLHSPY